MTVRVTWAVGTREVPDEPLIAAAEAALAEGGRAGLDVDVVLCFLGFKPDLGPIKSWGLEVDENRIVVSQLMETSVEGIYAAGDLVSYPGKLDLIANGYGEAAIAVNNAVHYLHPEARVNPGHSTNLAIFKDK